MSSVSQTNRFRKYANPMSDTKRARTTKNVSSRVPRPIKVGLGKQAIPPQLTNEVTYGCVLNLTPVSGQKQYVFSANGCYDPDVSGTGSQPLYFDQLAAIYAHYKVTSSRIEIHVMDVVGYNSLVTLYVDDDTSYASFGEDAMQRPGAVWSTYSGGVDLPKPLVKTWNAKKTFGTSDDSTLAGTAGAQPSEQSFFVFNYQDATAGRTAPFAIVVQIKYQVLWYEPKTIPTS